MKTELIAILSLAAVLAVSSGAAGKRCGSGGCLLTPEAMAQFANSDAALREIAAAKIEKHVTERSTAAESPTPANSR